MARILIAEDDPHMLRVLSMWLRRNGHDIVEAGDGDEAMRKIEAQCPDLILSDFNMPRVDGLTLIRWIRQNISRSVPIIILSSRADQANLASQLQNDNVEVCPKPFSPSRLVSTIEGKLSPAASG